MKSDLMASPKKLKLDVRSFQELWTTDFGFVSRDELAVCVCSVFKTSFAEHQILNDILKRSTRNLSRTMQKRSSL